MRNSLRAFLATFVVILAAFTRAQSIPAPPATFKRPVIDQFQGVKVTDDYRWLENWDDPDVKLSHPAAHYLQCRARLWHGTRRIY